jgi:hypothetical protein
MPNPPKMPQSKGRYAAVIKPIPKDIPDKKGRSNTTNGISPL